MMSTKTRIVPVAFALLCASWVGTNVLYHAGGKGVRFQRGAATISFGRDHDVQLYEAFDGAALSVQAADWESSEPRELAVLALTPAPLPFRLLCGQWQRDGFTRNHDGAKAAFGDRVVIEPHPVAGERDRVMVSLSPQDLPKKYRAISTCNESCMVFNAAYLLLAIGLGVALVVGLVAARRRASGAAAST